MDRICHPSPVEGHLLASTLGQCEWRCRNTVHRRLLEICFLFFSESTQKLELLGQAEVLVLIL